MRLAICREPHADEFLWGYLHELCELNGMTMWELQNMINNGDSIVAFSLRYPTGLPFICDRIQNHTFPNLRRAMLMTPYGADIVECEDAMKIKLAEMVLQPKSPAFYRCNKIDSIGNHVRICPKCWSEDIKKYGSGYVHLSHQFRNVCVCTKHKVPLGTLKVENIRETVKTLDVSKISTIPVANMDTAYEYATELENAFLENQFLLHEVNCPKCGKRYLEHRQSKRMGTGCPFCNANRTPEAIINRRLRIRYGKNQYRVVPGFKNITTAKVEHVPCKHIDNNLEMLLYGKEKQICKYCSNKEKLNDSYVVIGKYSDGCEKILHKKCGIAFKMKRSEFQIGKRCPICGVSWDFSSIKRKVEECCGNRYKLLKSARKGYVYVLDSDNKVLAECSYVCVMRDLMSDTSRIFIKKHRKYVTKRDMCVQLFHATERSETGHIKLQERMQEICQGYQ